MSRRLILASSVVLLALVGCSKGEDKFGRLTVDQVAELVAKNDATLIDANTAGRFRQSHVPGAKWLQFNKIEASDLPADKTRKLVFYCAHML